MFTDMVGFTAMAKSDEDGALKLLREQEKLVRRLLKTHKGREIKSTGDGFLVEFDSALRGVQCAIDIQQRLQERNARPGCTPIRLRIGVHLGDVEERDSDIFGDSVNFAARIEPLAEPGGICVSEPVMGQVRNKIPNRLVRLEPKALKNVQFTMELYRVVLPWVDRTEEVASPAPPRLAVLPLANISPDPKDEYFADGLTEELISVLSQVRGLRVIARTSVSQYKGTTKPIAQIGSELGVSSVLEGSVRKADDQLRITVQLIDVRTEEHRWAMTYDRKLENVFAIQADVAERTAGALRIELLKSEREALREKPTSSLVAYESYLRGIQAFQRYGGSATEAADREASEYFEEAIRQDPQFSAAHSYLANHLIAAMGVTRPGREVLPRARVLVAKALELNPNSSDTHIALGNIAMQGDLDWARSEAEFRQGIGLNPSSSTAHFWYGYLLGVLQRFDEAREQDQTAIELDPLWLLPRLQLVWSYVNAGDLESAIRMGEKLKESFPGFGSVQAALANAYALAGRVDEALKALESMSTTPSLMARLSRAGILAFLGRPEEGKALTADLEGGHLHGYISAIVPAFFYAMQGEKEKALAHLEQDYREGDRVLWNYYQSEFLDPIRDEPRFVAMLRAMKLPTGNPRRLATNSGRGRLSGD
jgi:adenylate cyclase